MYVVAATNHTCGKGMRCTHVRSGRGTRHQCGTRRRRKKWNGGLIESVYAPMVSSSNSTICRHNSTRMFSLTALGGTTCSCVSILLPLLYLLRYVASFMQRVGKQVKLEVQLPPIWILKRAASARRPLLNIERTLPTPRTSSMSNTTTWG